MPQTNLDKKVSYYERIIAEGIGEKMVVYTTRDTDEFIPLSDRAKFANKHNAETKGVSKLVNKFNTSLKAHLNFFQPVFNFIFIISPLSCTA